MSIALKWRSWGIAVALLLWSGSILGVGVSWGKTSSRNQVRVQAAGDDLGALLGYYQAKIMVDNQTCPPASVRWNWDGKDVKTGNAKRNKATLKWLHDGQDPSMVLFFSSVPLSDLVVMKGWPLVQQALPVLVGFVSSPGNLVINCFGLNPQDPCIDSAEWVAGDVGGFRSRDPRHCSQTAGREFLPAEVGGPGAHQPRD